MAGEKGTSVTVARGRTVHHDGKEYGPGSTLTLLAEEAAHLRRAGFLFEPEPVADAVTGVPSVNGENGSVVRPQ